MKTSVTQSSRRLFRGGLALLALGLTQCDPLKDRLVVKCQPDDTECVTGSSGDGSAIDLPTVPDLTTPGPNTPIGPPRKLEWRASIALDASKMKFVGMRETMPVFWAKDGTSPSRWVVYQTDLLATDAASRILPVNVPTTDFPGVGKISWLGLENNELLLANKTFVKMQPGSPSDLPPER